jgi:hypothetical protein
MTNDPHNGAPIEPGPQGQAGLYADLGAIVGVLTDGGVPLDPQAAFCLITIGYGILVSAQVPVDDMQELHTRAWFMARELAPVIQAALRGKETT